MTDRSNSKRLNKAISDSGYCSRREADKLIEAGKVFINGNKAKLGERVVPEDEITVDGNKVLKSERTIFIAMYKPVGITCTTDKRIKGNVIDLDDVIREQVYLSLPIKRLCRETCSGLCPSCGLNLNKEQCQCGKRPGHHAEPANVQADRGIELQGAPAGRRFGITEHDADLLADLVDEHDRRL